MCQQESMAQFDAEHVTLVKNALEIQRKIRDAEEKVAKAIDLLRWGKNVLAKIKTLRDAIKYLDFVTDPEALNKLDEIKQFLNRIEWRILTKKKTYKTIRAHALRDMRAALMYAKMPLKQVQQELKKYKRQMRI